MIRTQLAIVFAAVLPLCVGADEGDDTLRFMLAKADLVVLGKIVSEPVGIILKPGVPHYVCDFAVEDVLKGDASLTNTTIGVEIIRFEMGKQDHDPLIKKASRCILFFGKRRPEDPTWATVDIWFGVQHPFPWLARSLKRLADHR